jgi:small subunit ribosomal protein S16
VSLRIRLSRVGAKKQASYRIVVAESTAPRDGKNIAILGHYNPLTDPYTLKVNEESAIRWLRNGAQPSETARGLLSKAGVLSAYESARSTGKPKAKKAAGEAAEETKARRTARAKRTEAPRLVRPGKRPEGEVAEAAAATGMRKAAAAKPAAGRTAAKSEARKGPASKAKSGATKTAGGARKATSESRASKAKAQKG